MTWIDLLHLTQFVAVIGGMATAIWKISGFSYRLGELTGAFTETFKTQQAILLENRAEVKELRQESKQQLSTIAGVLTAIAVQDNRIDRVEADVREIKHGDGLVITKK